MNTVFDTFKLRAEAVSAEVHLFPQKEDALRFVLACLKDAGVKDEPEARAVWASCSFLNGMSQTAISSQMPGVTFEVNREVAAQARVGISELDWAIANTGTLMQDASAVDCRLASTLPLIHIALVRSDRLVPDLGAALAKVRPQRSNYISFITGPSRTADIERVLTIGVHGPEKLIIVFYDGNRNASERVN